MAEIPSSSTAQSAEASNQVQAPPNAMNIEANRRLTPHAILEALQLLMLDRIPRLFKLMLILLFGYFIVYKVMHNMHHDKHKFECKPDAIVTLDGSGNFTSVSDAVAAAPNNSKKKYCIFIKSGIYIDNVEVGLTKKNIVFAGEGMNETVITSVRSGLKGDTATVRVLADGFMAINLTMENSAGVYRENAAAFHSSSDQSILYRCIFRGYQSTLTLVQSEQLFKDCIIYGTHNFIVGDAMVVFQNCSVFVGNPLPMKNNAIIAQGGTELEKGTGFVFHYCIIDSAPDVIPSLGSTYLGLSFGVQSTIVIMQSFMGGLINPAGWVPYNGTVAANMVTYGEFNNTGPEAITINRIRLNEFRILSVSEAKMYTVGAFINKPDWLSATGVPYLAGLFL